MQFPLRPGTVAMKLVPKYRALLHILGLKTLNLGLFCFVCCQGWVASILKFNKDWLQMYKSDDKL